MEKKYVLEVQLSPKIHRGEMQYYWHIDLVTEDGSFTIRDGFQRCIQSCFDDAMIKYTLLTGL